MRAWERLSARWAIARELVAFFAANKWWWLLPMVLLLLLAGVFILVAQSSAIAPFIYTLF